MTSTFRLTRAEFKKIFKRASVYIMTLLLVIAVLVSAYIFKPSSYTDKTISYGDNLSVSDYYDYFYNKDLSNTKKGLDKDYFGVASNIHNYFSLLADRDLKLTQNYNDVVTSYNQMTEATDNAIKNNRYEEFKANIKSFYDNFQDFSEFDSTNYPYIKYSTTAYTNSSGDNYYIVSNSSNIKNLYDKSLDTSIDCDDMVNIIKTNDYINKLSIDLNAGINFIRPTIYAMAIDIKNAYINFNEAYNRGSQAPALNAMETNRKALKTAVEAFKTYFDLLKDNNFPIITITKELEKEVTSNLEFAIGSLGASIFTGTTQTYSDYSSLQTNLTSIDIANYFTKTFSENNNKFTQVKLKATLIAEFEKVKTKVESNRVEIENTIKEHRTDESIKNIQKCITNYSLLGETYINYLDDRIKISLNSEYRSDELVKLYNYDFDKFNIYEAEENLTRYSYYIDNNIYENSFNQNYVLMQSSKDTPNAFEFMYFSMEICTVLIIIFAMMMMCNLITSETESGTIKLLLTRPYRRSKIITAKLFATIFFVIIFLIFSALISFAGGYFLYGVDLTNILVVFNGTTAISISPIWLTLINMLSCLLDILFYVIISLMISILFKNYAGSISFCFIIIIATYALNMLFGGAFWYSLLPSPNLNLFKYFGNSFLTSSSNILQNILITPIQSTMNFWYSLLILASYSIVSIAVSYAVFNKRDF